MLSDVALLAVPLLLVAAPRNPMMNAPGQVSATSHSLAAGRHTVPPLPGGCWQLVLVPSQVSAVQGSPSSGHAAPAFPAGCVHVVLVPLHTSAVQGLPSSVQAVPFDLKTSLGQVVLLPVQLSATSHSPAAARHTAPALPAGCWQVLLMPLHWSSVQGLVSAVQAVPFAFLASAGQLVLVPSQLSATSHSPPTARQTAPALPAGCWQTVLVPLHWSRVQGLPSSVQAAPAFPAGCWQVLFVPSHWSRVHGLLSAVQDVPLAFLTSAGQVELVPVQVSARSHSAAAARQTAPALPTGCWQSTLVPLHWSRVQALPSSVQAVPLAFRGPSAGHVALEPVQVSGRSHSPAAARQVCELLKKVQLFLQHEPAAPFNALPRSQSSPDSTVPLPQVPGASVNVVSAVWPEERPAAVSVNVTPRSKTSTVKSVFVKSPFESATDVSARSGSNGGSSCRTMSTVSPGSQPLPVMVTVCPG